jgi:hypothetical protein
MMTITLPLSVLVGSDLREATYPMNWWVFWVLTNPLLTLTTVHSVLLQKPTSDVEIAKLWGIAQGIVRPNIGNKSTG